jgi:hypothetical protein
MLVSLERNSGQNQDIKIGKKSLKKYLGMTVINTKFDSGGN